MAKKVTLELTKSELTAMLWAMRMTGNGSERLRNKLAKSIDELRDDKEQRALARATTKEN